MKVEIDSGNIKANTGSFRVVAPSSGSPTSIPTVVRFEAKEFEETNRRSAEEVRNPFGLKSCQDCNGWSCCATGGCVNCGCGWVCG